MPSFSQHSIVFKPQWLKQMRVQSPYLSHPLKCVAERLRISHVADGSSSQPPRRVRWAAGSCCRPD